VKALPSTPFWLKKTAWFCAAAIGPIACIVISFVERILEASFPWAFLILCLAQSVSCFLSGLFYRFPSLKRPLVWTIRIAAILLTVLTLVLAFNWLNYFRLSE